MKQNSWWESDRWASGEWSQTMGNLYSPYLIPLIILILVMLVAIFLILFFRRPAPSDNLSLLSFVSENSNPGLEGTPTKMGSDTTENGDDALERETYLVIPDISGYTRFLSLNRFSIGHAQHIISKLLGAVIESATPQLAPAKIEGDAILFYGFTDQAGKLVGADLGTTVVNLLSAFYNKREELQQSNICPCAACKRIAELDLKVVVHRGPVLRYRLGGFPELSGVPVIAIHRLLKNSVGLQRYVMVTEEAFSNCKLPLHLAASPHVESYDGVGGIASYVYAFEIDDVVTIEASPGSVPPQAGTKDMLQKISKNVHTLGKSIGLS